MPFGQVVIGPPGSGKTTYCAGMQQFLRASNRKVAVINLDPANDDLPYEAAVDISELVALEEVMEHFKLGPNGGERRSMACQAPDACSAQPPGCPADRGMHAPGAPSSTSHLQCTRATAHKHTYASKGACL
jgi:hypothetical protein